MEVLNLKKKVAVLFGGRTLEHEISIITALQAMKALDSTLYEIIPVYIDLRGKWYCGQGLLNSSIYKNFRPENLKGKVQEVTLLPDPSVGGLVTLPHFSVIKVDVFLLAFHGQYGEDGSIQGLLELADKVYTGGGVLPMALSMNKGIFKHCLKGLDIPIVPGIILTFSELDQLNAEELLQKIRSVENMGDGALFVKPNNLGSSVGISKVQRDDQLLPALMKAFKYDHQVLVERCVEEMMEINVSVRRNTAGVAEISVVEVPVASAQGVLTYEDKYLREGKGKKGASGSEASGGMASLARKIDPQDLDPSLRSAVQRMALKVYTALGVEGVVRFDFIFDQKRQRLYLNELNTIPGSLSFYLWEAGLQPKLYSKVLDDLIANAFLRKEESLRLKKSFGFKALGQ